MKFSTMKNQIFSAEPWGCTNPRRDRRNVIAFRDREPASD
jgi:hypothetical protein